MTVAMLQEAAHEFYYCYLLKRMDICQEYHDKCEER